MVDDPKITEKDGKKYEIKTQKLNYPKQKLLGAVPSLTKLQLETTDFVVYIEFDYNWNVGRLFCFPIDFVKNGMDKQNSIRINRRDTSKYNLLIKATSLEEIGRYP